jgi:hypothetical protein
MEASVHPIEGRRRSGTHAVASPGDFALGPGETIEAGTVVAEPGWSLYCIDRGRRAAVFVELPPEVDLAAATFVYDTQFQRAGRVALVPLAGLEDLASRVEAPEHAFFIFSIGRCGSTLVNKALNRVDGVWCLSEPDVFTQLVLERGKVGGVDVGRLLTAATRLLFRPPKARRVFGIKLRSQSLFQAGILHEAFPAADFVFIYRDGLGWAKSYYEFLRTNGMPAELGSSQCYWPWWAVTGGASASYAQDYVDVANGRLVPIEEMLAPGWAFNLEAYLGFVRAGVPFKAVRYNELIGEREATMAGLLAHCHLPAGAVADAIGAFERDSQEGMSIGRDRNTAGIAFTAENAERFARTLARHPSIRTADFMVPDAGRVGDGAMTAQGPDGG